MNDQKRQGGSGAADPKEKNLRDAGGFEETPAPQGLKTPPPIEPGEDSGEWPRGGGSDPNEPAPPKAAPPPSPAKKN